MRMREDGGGVRRRENTLLFESNYIDSKKVKNIKF